MIAYQLLVYLACYLKVSAMAKVHSNKSHSYVDMT